MTLNSLIDLYIEDLSPRIRESTMLTKQNIINSKIHPFLGNDKVESIDERKIRRWQNRIISLENENGELFSKTYIKTINNQLSAILNYVVKYYRLTYNPIHKTGSIGKKHAKEMHFWTLDQFNQTMSSYDFCDKQKNYHFSTYQYKFPFNILFYTGIRVGELLALIGKDFNKENKILEINKSHQRINKKDIITFPKTDTSITNVTIPSFLFDMLDEYTNHIYNYQSKNRLFNGIGKTTPSKQMYMISDWTNVPKIRVHDLRHSHALLLIKQGVNFKVIQQRLGHKDIQTTLNTYSHLWDTAHQEVGDLLNNLSPK